MKTQSHSVQNLFVFLLLGFFAVTGTLLIAMEAQSYRNCVSRAELHASERVLSGYIRTAVRCNDRADAVSIADEGGIETLVFTADYGGDIYLTRLYCHDGQFRELFTSADRAFEPEAGEPICEADAFTATLEGNLLTAVLTEGGESYTVHIALRCGETEATP